MGGETLGVSDKWRIRTNPFLEMSYVDGGKIFFRGLDSSMRLTGITAERGKLCWVWVEEAFEIEHEDDFCMIDESIRGIVGDGLFKQLTMTFNPWNDGHCGYRNKRKSSQIQGLGSQHGNLL